MKTKDFCERGVSVVVPAYRSKGTLAELAQRLEHVFEELGREFEIVLVNDGSGDGTWDVIRRLAETTPNIRGIDLLRNYGQHNALLCGIRLARHTTIVTMDDDLQNPPEEIPKLLEALDEGCDVVYGRPLKEQNGVLRDMASRLTKMILQHAIGVPRVRHVSAFRAFRTQLREAFEQFNGTFVSIDVLLSWGASHYGVASVEHEPRNEGESGYTVGRLVVHAVNMLTGFSTAPLRFASWTGFLLTIVGVMLLVFVVTRYLLFGTEAPGFPFLASIISIFSGAQLFAMGILGEYLARVHSRMMDRPPYVIGGAVGGLEGS